MIRVLKTDDMRRCDSNEKSKLPPYTLMDRAGEALYSSVVYKEPVCIVCGEGNNGGDGYALASILLEKNIDVHVLCLKSKMTDDGKHFFEKLPSSKVSFYDDSFDFSNYNTIVDCIFGTGFHGKIDKQTEGIINKINESGAYIVSCDINSGLNGNSGLGDTIIKSDLTVSIGSYKPGHFLGKSKDYISSLLNCDIGIKEDGDKIYLIEMEDVKNIFEKRKNYSHKGTYGNVAIIGGSVRYSGAIKLANISQTAVRCGCGICTLCVPKCITDGVLPYIMESTLYPMSSKNGYIQFKKEELDEIIKDKKAIAIGMGIGNTKESKKITEYLLSTYTKTLILDADALNSIADNLDAIKDSKANVILTPHLGEFSRLSKIEKDELETDPILYASSFAQKYNCTVLLKGPSTIVTDGKVTYITSTGCPGMACGGSGDVLSGIICSLFGYAKGETPFIASCASYINGLSGEIAQKKRTDITMTSLDTANSITDALESLINS